tara:strand:+ start:436 stop:588 length:153 start_codon:yes stop_codon:yes gene_type:complete
LDSYQSNRSQIFIDQIGFLVDNVLSVTLGWIYQNFDPRHPNNRKYEAAFV